MSKEEFYQKNDQKFLPLGFVKESEDPMFYYYKNLVTDEVIGDMDLVDWEVPKLLYGTTGINSGFCLYSGSHFIWLNATTPEEAIEISSKVVAFEEC